MALYYNAISYSNLLFTSHYSVFDYSLQFRGNVANGNHKNTPEIKFMGMIFHEYSDKLAAIYATELAIYVG